MTLSLDANVTTEPPHDVDDFPKAIFGWTSTDAVRARLTYSVVNGASAYLDGELLPKDGVDVPVNGSGWIAPDVEDSATFYITVWGADGTSISKDSGVIDGPYA